MANLSKEVAPMPHPTIRIAEDIHAVDLPLALGVLTATVHVDPRSEAVWKMLQEIGKIRATKYTPDTLKDVDHIASFRELYRRIGKDPSRYRPSSEMLIRRVTRNQPLYTVNNVVDIMNYLSIDTYLPMGLYDQKRIVGDITFRIGRAGEGFQGIRKGIVNVESLPVLADNMGAFGDPSSDSERTMIRPETTNILLVIFSCLGNPDSLLEQTAEQAKKLYSAYASAAHLEFSVVK